MVRVGLVSVLVLAWWSAAQGAPARGSVDEARVQAARSHFELGRVLFKESKFEEALREFEAGYALVPQPRFLLNMGQAYRSLKQPDRAVEMYEKFLSLVPADDPDRGTVNELLAVVRAEAAKMPPKPAPPPPVVPPPTVVQPEPQISLKDSDRGSPAGGEPKRSFARRNWWIFPVVGVVVAGAAIGLGVGLTQSGGGCHGPEPCLDLGAR